MTKGYDQGFMMKGAFTISHHRELGILVALVSFPLYFAIHETSTRSVDQRDSDAILTQWL
jgi:hypothetical protein